MGIPAGTSMSRPAKKRLAKSKKKHWRKGTDITDVESYLRDKAHDEAHGGALSLKLDEDLFTIDNLPSKAEVPEKETVKQKAFMLRREKRLEAMVKEEEVEPSKRSQKKDALLSRIKLTKKIPEPAQKKEKKTVPKGQYDLWETNLVPNVEMEDEESVDHYLTQTKKKLPKMPGSMRHVSSLLPKVTVAKAGASYNPTKEEYLEYVNQFAEEEKKLQLAEKKLEKKMRLQEGETYITAAEKLAETMQGLQNEDVEKVEDEEEQLDEAVSSEGAVNADNMKTEKQRRIAKTEKLKLLMAKDEKSKKQLDNDVFKAPKLNKQIKKRIAEVDLNAKMRKKRKAIKKLTTRQNLGRGDFEKFEEPFLLEEELSSSLRKMQAPAGTTVLKERLKSMQIRNLLPVPGEKPKRVLRRKLKAKMIEKRSVKEITQGSKVF